MVEVCHIGCRVGFLCVTNKLFVSFLSIVSAESGEWWGCRWWAVRVLNTFIFVVLIVSYPFLCQLEYL